MKFNKLLRATVQARMPQWSEHVMGYKVLKQGLRRILKQSADGEMQPSEASSSFTDLLDVEVEKVNDFYSERIEEAVIILHALRQHVDQANSLTPNSLTHNSITLSHVSHTTLSHSNASHTNTHFPHMSHSHVPPHVTLARIL